MPCRVPRKEFRFTAVKRITGRRAPAGDVIFAARCVRRRSGQHLRDPLARGTAARLAAGVRGGVLAAGVLGHQLGKRAGVEGARRAASSNVPANATRPARTSSASAGARPPSRWMRRARTTRSGGKACFGMRSWLLRRGSMGIGPRKMRCAASRTQCGNRGADAVGRRAGRPRGGALHRLALPGHPLAQDGRAP